MNRSIAFLIISTLLLGLTAVPGNGLEPRSAVEIIEKVNANFVEIKDLTAEVKLETTLFLFGCAGQAEQRGTLYFKAPDKIRATLNGVTYFAHNNTFRRIDEQGKRFYVYLLNALDFAVGYQVALIPYNFYLTLTKDSPEEIIIEGTPKPGILKNARLVRFYIDTQDYLLRKFDVVFPNKSLNGTIHIDYERIGGLWVPVGFYGQTALELQNNTLIGFGIRFRSENVKINLGLPDKIFDPGF